MPGDGDVVLLAEDLTLAWDDMTPVVRDVSLSVREGETCCLVGRSGTGKTTILHALAGLRRPLFGHVSLHGVDVTGTPGQVSYLLQKDLLVPSLRVIDNVCLPLTLAGVPRADAHERVRALLGLFGLVGAESRWPGELSGGMRQRAAFLRTYLMGAPAVLLDEPFSALDALTRDELRRWFCEMVCELGLSALVITHDVDEAVLMARRVYVLSGSPAAGIPSRLVAEVEVDHDGQAVDDFALTPAYLDAKRSILVALGEREDGPP